MCATMPSSMGSEMLSWVSDPILPTADEEFPIQKDWKHAFLEQKDLNSLSGIKQTENVNDRCLFPWNLNLLSKIQKIKKINVFFWPKTLWLFSMESKYFLQRILKKKFFFLIFFEFFHEGQNIHFI